MLYATLNSAEPHDARAALLAEECALAISYNGLNHAVMMVTPQDLEEFVIGFSLAGGLIERLDDLRDLRLLGDGSARRADVQVSPRAFWTLKQQRRQLAGTSGCGLCGWMRWIRHCLSWCRCSRQHCHPKGISMSCASALRAPS